MRLVRRFLLALVGLASLALPASAQYPYSHVPRILYVIGQPNWDQLPAGAGGSRSLQVFGDEQMARDRAGGATIYRIQRHTLARTPDGEALLQAIEAQRSDRKQTQKDVFDFPLSATEA